MKKVEIISSCNSKNFDQDIEKLKKIVELIKTYSEGKTLSVNTNKLSTHNDGKVR